MSQHGPLWEPFGRSVQWAEIEAALRGQQSPKGFQGSLDDALRPCKPMSRYDWQEQARAELEHPQTPADAGRWLPGLPAASIASDAPLRHQLEQWQAAAFITGGRRKAPGDPKVSAPPRRVDDGPTITDLLSRPGFPNDEELARVARARHRQHAEGKTARRVREGPSVPKRRTYLVTPPKAHLRQDSPDRGVDYCPRGQWFWERCGHGAMVLRWAPCNTWTCGPCKRYRIMSELTPAIEANMRRALDGGRMLKFVTLTFKPDDPAGENTPEGRDLRTRRFADLMKWIKRNYGWREYLRVSETHKRGRIHVHALLDAPYIPHAALYARWGARIEIKAVYAKCPDCWPGREADKAAQDAAKAKLRPDGRVRCGNGHVQEKQAAAVQFAVSAAWEAGMYIGKSQVGRMSHSRRWIVADKGQPDDCGDCAEPHRRQWDGQVNRVVYHPSGKRFEFEPDSADLAAQVEIAHSCAVMAPGRGPCGCFGDRKWLMHPTDISLENSVSASDVGAKHANAPP